MSRSDWIALALAVCVIFITAWISINIFEGLPHLEDEFAYIWQAQAIERGQLTTPSPSNSKSFLVPFVVDYNNQRFGKYPLGWPVVLSFGERFGLRQWVNPLLAGLGVWLIYRLGKKTLGETVGLLSAGLLVSSPFFLMNSGALLAHPWGLVLSTFFVIAWLDVVDERRSAPGWLPALSAALTLGILALSRPVTALGLALIFGIHGLCLLWRGSAVIRRRIISIGLMALFIGSLHLVWQYALTGDPLRNPYTLWWEYDKFGFGPGYGVTADGHNLAHLWYNLRRSMRAGVSDLFGWGKLSWIFLPFGIWAVRRQRKAWSSLAVFPVLVIIYMGYWVGAWLFGPRYYYEGLYSLTLLSAAGIAWLAGWPVGVGEQGAKRQGWGKARPLGVTALVGLLMAVNLIFYAPARLGDLRGLYGVESQQLAPFEAKAAQSLAPALIFVHPEHWREYSVLTMLSSPFFDTPFVFVYSRGTRLDAEISAQFPERKIYHYYPDEPWKFYEARR